MDEYPCFISSNDSSYGKCLSKIYGIQIAKEQFGLIYSFKNSPKVYIPKIRKTKNKLFFDKEQKYFLDNLSDYRISYNNIDKIMKSMHNSFKPIFANNNKYIRGFHLNLPKSEIKTAYSSNSFKHTNPFLIKKECTPFTSRNNKLN